MGDSESKNTGINGLPGQMTMPGLECEMGYDSAMLDPRHERFCRNFIIDDNATKAYMRVYPGSSYEAARANSARLIANDNIQKRIEALRELRCKRLEVDADRVFMELARKAFFNIDDLQQLDHEGKPIPIQNLDRDTLAGIHSLEFVTGSDGRQITKVKAYDALKALELLGKTTKLSLFSENINMSQKSRFKDLSDEELEAEEERLEREIAERYLQRQQSEK